ncbi:MAG: NADH:ubiquinone oxidoreductase subunit 2 (subunit N) [Halioglobus sp.]|jgi:NADH:ubiquinone oxidoreductase subunit 2 (subunit N)
MSVPGKHRYRSAMFAAIAFIPWLISMYMLYWFERDQIWVVETLHRDKMTVAILLTGMVLSFLLQSYFLKREKNTH